MGVIIIIISGEVVVMMMMMNRIVVVVKLKGKIGIVCKKGRRQEEHSVCVCVTRLPNGERWGRKGGRKKFMTVASNLSHTIFKIFSFF